MIRDNIENARTVITTAYKLTAGEGLAGDSGRYSIGYRQGVFDLAGELLWPEQSWQTRRERLARLFDAHTALFVEVPK
jgi:hypothetical protein